MTQDATPSAAADLSYLRNLATAGQNAPLMAGPYLVAGGAWFAAASLLQWPVIRDVLGLDAGQAVLAWLLAAAGFAVHLTVLLRRDRGRAENTSNRAVNAVWSGIGWCIFAFWVGAAIMSYRKGDAFLMNAISLHVLAVYGVGWTVAAVMTGRGWMQFNAAMALLTVPVLGALVGTGQEYLAYAIALVLTAIVPGLRIMRESRLVEPSPNRS
jgi:hypothetical protein